MAGWIPDEVTLRNGDRVLVRTIRPDDSAGLLALHARLSRDSIYRRYFSARPRLTPVEVRRFTVIEQDWRFALVATRPAGDLLAVARYEGRAGERHAEVALIVDDAVQRGGLGGVLLRRLVDVATLRGLGALVAEVLPGNAAMLRLLGALRVPRDTRHGDGVVTVTLDLTAVDLAGERERIAAGHVAHAESIRAGSARRGAVVPARAPD